ncbi:MAG: YicC/YloC family endoribonuclease [Thermodesulfobacteriota bacterium]
MKSMTGYANSEKSIGNEKIIVEARSENHRFLDFKIQIPDSLNSIEHELVDLVRKNVSRGKLKITIIIESENSKLLNFNEQAGRKYINTLRKVVSNLGIKDDINLNHLLIFKELFNSDLDSGLSKLTVKKVKEVLITTLNKLDKSRSVEGQKLKKDFAKRIKKCESQINSVKRKRNNFSKQAFKKLKERTELLLEDMNIDDNRLYQEIAIQTERSDITEELVRLDAHAGKFIATLNKKGPVGKELDFLIQEMNREAGTISAKSKDAKISHHIIILRSELEKMREQIQNIE